MWKRLECVRHQRRLFHTTRTWHEGLKKPVIDIQNASFYRQYPSAGSDATPNNPALFPSLTFSLPYQHGSKNTEEYWAVLSASSIARTTFLQILAGQFISIPPTARTYPYLSEISTSPQHGIRYVGFDAERGSSVGGTNVRGAYLSARYESRREETDYSLLDYLTGNTELNALEHQQTETEKSDLQSVIKKLNLGNLLEMPVANLSNGQTRRARIAKALLSRPEALLLDGPFMGLDPNTSSMMDGLLKELATSHNPRVIMSLRPEDGIPEWITHLVVADEEIEVLKQGTTNAVLADSNPQSLPDARSKNLTAMLEVASQGRNAGTTAAFSKDAWSKNSPALPPGEALVEMSGVKVAYGDKVVLGKWTQEIQGEQKPGLWWTLHRGQRAGIFGPNGSGKTTMLSLITSDHPQTYSLPIKLFGRSRLPGPGEAGISLFDIQRRMGHSSPEVHAFFPKSLTVRRALESAFADAPLARAKLTPDQNRRVDAFLRWFARELNPNHDQHTPTTLEAAVAALQKGDLTAAQTLLNNPSPTDLSWANDIRFAELPFSSQRLLLFLRALVSTPDLVILDEALSGIDDKVRDKALLFLSHGEKFSPSHNTTNSSSEPSPSVLAQMGQLVFEGLSEQQALLVISHAKEDVPGCVREWICLPEPGEGRSPRKGTLEGPLELNPRGWEAIWGREVK